MNSAANPRPQKTSGSSVGVQGKGAPADLDVRAEEGACLPIGIVATPWGWEESCFPMPCSAAAQPATPELSLARGTRQPSFSLLPAVGAWRSRCHQVAGPAAPQWGTLVTRRVTPCRRGNEGESIPLASVRTDICSRGLACAVRFDSRV